MTDGGADKPARRINFVDWQRQRQLASLADRPEVLRLPLVPLRRHAYLRPGDRHSGWQWDEPVVGIGFDGDACALWRSPDGSDRVLRTLHGAARSEATVLYAAHHPGHVQSLRSGGTLVTAPRGVPGSPGATLLQFDAEGHIVRTADAGRAVEQLLVDAGDSVWVGYFDEGVLAPSNVLGNNGLVRLGTSLDVEWLYRGRGLPIVDSLYSLNVGPSAVLAYAYSAFHLIRIVGDDAVDCGPAPHGIGALLLEGDRGAIIGGAGDGEYDVITPVTVTAEGLQPSGPRTRLVRPDGMELGRAGINPKMTCRGTELHVILDGTGWYRLSLDDLVREA